MIKKRDPHGKVYESAAHAAGAYNTGTNLVIFVVTIVIRMVTESISTSFKLNTPK